MANANDVKIEVGTKLRLKKALYFLHNIGDVFTVTCVDECDGGNTIHFTCRYGSGAISADAVGEYFDIVNDEENSGFKVGDIIKLTKVCNGLEPMSLNELFRVDTILTTGVITLFRFMDNTSYYLSENLVNDCFKKVAIKLATREAVTSENTEIPTVNAKEDVKTAVEPTETKTENKIPSDKSVFKHRKGQVLISVTIDEDKHDGNENKHNCCACSCCSDCAGAEIAPYKVVASCDNETNLLFPEQVSEDYIDGLIADSDVNVETIGKITVVTMTMDNGFAISESALRTSEIEVDGDEDAAIVICLNKIKNRLWEMESYFLHKICEYETRAIEMDFDTVNCDEVDCDDCPVGCCLDDYDLAEMSDFCNELQNND